MPESFIPCTLKLPPPEGWMEAAKRAIQHNPANAPRMPAGAASNLVLQPMHLALLTSKYWGSGGVRLSVAFLDTSASALQQRILSHMNTWGQRANVQFSLSQSQSADVRISRTPRDGYWSYLGTDIHGIPAGQPTMNLENFSMDTPESEYRRVVRHETGHTLGFPHEHMRRDIVARIDPQKAIDYFGRTQGWSADEVRAQVLTPLEEAQLTALPADIVSIMCYQLPGSITVDGQPIPGGTDIDEEDFTLAAKVYPKSVTPPPPPPPGGKLFSLSFARPIPRGQRVQFAAPVTIPAGTYDVSRSS